MQSEKVLPHSDLKQIDERVWIVEGELPHHNPLPRTMTIYKMESGELWIHSAIALNNAVQSKIEALGRPRYLVVPNTMHRMDAPVYKEAYPTIQVVCPRAAREKVEQVVHVDGVCEDVFTTGEIKALLMSGVDPIELAYEIDLKDGKAMILNDIIANKKSVPGIGGFLLKIMGRIGKFRTPPITKLIFVKNRPAFRGWLMDQAAKTDIRLVTVAHGSPVSENVSVLFQRAALEM